MLVAVESSPGIMSTLASDVQLYVLDLDQLQRGLWFLPAKKHVYSICGTTGRYAVHQHTL